MWKDITVEKEIFEFFENFIKSKTIFNLIEKETNQVVPVLVKVLNLNSKEIIIRPLKEQDIFLFEQGCQFEFSNLKENIIFAAKGRKIHSKLIYALCPRSAKLNELREKPRFSLWEREDTLKLENQSIISYQSGHRQFFEGRIYDVSENGLRLEVSLLDNEANQNLILPKSKIKLVSLNGTEFGREIVGRIVYHQKNEELSQGQHAHYSIGIKAEGNHHFMEAILGNPLA